MSSAPFTCFSSSGCLFHTYWHSHHMPFHSLSCVYYHPPLSLLLLSSQALFSIFSCDLLYSLTIFFPAVANLLLNPSNDFLLSVILYINSKIIMWYLLKISTSLPKFSILYFIFLTVLSPVIFKVCADYSIICTFW